MRLTWRLDEQQAAVGGEYAERMTEGIVFPPVVLFHDGNGFHRAMAARRNQFRDIAADVQPGTTQDALWFALGANKANWQRLTDADKKHAILLAFKAWPDKSAGVLTAQIGCSQDYISELRAQVKDTFALPDRVVGNDGKRYAASRAKRTVEPVELTPLPVKDRTRAGIAASRERMRDMAAGGYNSTQIAGAVVKARAW